MNIFERNLLTMPFFFIVQRKFTVLLFFGNRVQWNWDTDMDNENIYGVRPQTFGDSVALGSTSDLL